ADDGRLSAHGLIPAHGWFSPPGPRLSPAGYFRRNQFGSSGERPEAPDRAGGLRLHDALRTLSGPRCKGSREAEGSQNFWEIGTRSKKLLAAASGFFTRGIGTW